VGKYDRLREHLARVGRDEVTMTFAEIERLVGGLPASATTHRPWWGNQRSARRVQARSWMDAGYEVDHVDQAAGVVCFRRS
jgi:hypothetical protein